MIFIYIHLNNIMLFVVYFHLFHNMILNSLSNLYDQLQSFFVSMGSFVVMSLVLTIFRWFGFLMDLFGCVMIIMIVLLASFMSFILFRMIAFKITTILMLKSIQIICLNLYNQLTYYLIEIKYINLLFLYRIQKSKN